MEEKKKGGKRRGAGRKSLLNKKEQVSIYVEKNKILMFGNLDKMKLSLYDYIDKHLGFGEERNGEPQAISDTTKRLLEPTHLFVPKNEHITITRSPEQWHELKRDCQSTEEWLEVKEQLLAATNLSDKQKQIIINTP